MTKLRGKGFVFLFFLLCIKWSITFKKSLNKSELGLHGVRESVPTVHLLGRGNEGLTRDRLEERDVPAGELHHEGLGCLGQLWVVVRVAVILEPKPQELLVDVLRLPSLRVPRLVGVRDPVTAGVRGVDLGGGVRSAEKKKNKASLVRVRLLFRFELTSSMRRIFPSSSTPNSYLVSTRSRLFFLATSWP